MDIKETAAFRAAKRATTGRLQSGLGGDGEWGSVPDRRYRLGDWNRVLWAAFTRCASPLFPPHVPLPNTQLLKDGILEGVAEAMRDSPVPHLDIPRTAQNVQMDLSWAPGIFPLPGTPEDAAPYLDRVFQALADSKPVFVKHSQVLATADLTHTGGIDPTTRLTRPLALYFERAIVGVPESRIDDPCWESLRSATEVILRKMPVYPLAKAPKAPRFTEPLPCLFGAIVKADADGKIDPEVVYLVSPRAFVLGDDGLPRHDIGIGTTVVPVMASSQESRLLGMVYGLTAAAVRTLGNRSDQGEGLRPVPLTMPGLDQGDGGLSPA